MTYDIIPDIHGQFEKLNGLLRQLGWQKKPSGWSNDEPGRQIIFLGDFIDRGPENREVLSRVRELVDAGKALAIMGNHELNAIHYHTPHPDQSGQYLRPHSPKNTRQHESFLREFDLGALETQEVINWMCTLPLYLEMETFRAVHACWDEEVISLLRNETVQGVFSEAQIRRAADKQDPFFDLVETTTKGPEEDLPAGYSFSDKDGTERKSVRIKWWDSSGRTWPELAMSIPNPAELPSGNVPEAISKKTYPRDVKPVFFGHYWLVGKPVLQSPNAICLDYSAGKDGPLLGYRLAPGDCELSTERIVGC